MFALTAKVIALGIACTISPMIVTASILLISGKKDPAKRLFAFMLGGVLIFALLIVAALQIWQGNLTLSSGDTAQHGNRLVGQVLALTMVIAGLWMLLSPAKKQAPLPLPDSLALIFASGLFLYATNIKALIFVLAAMHAILSADVMLSSKAVLALLSGAFFILPSLFPLAVYTFARKDADRLIPPVRRFFDRYGAYVLAVVFIGIGTMILLGK